MPWYLHREQTLFGRFLNWRARRNCKHLVYYMDTMTERDANGNVHATCDKCGKELTADCGLHLPAELRQRKP